MTRAEQSNSSPTYGPGRDDEQRLVTRPEPVEALAVLDCLHSADLQTGQLHQMQRVQVAGSNSARTCRIKAGNPPPVPPEVASGVPPGRAPDADH